MGASTSGSRALARRSLPWLLAAAILAWLFHAVHFDALAAAGRGAWLALAVYSLFEILAILPADAFATREALAAAGVRRGFGELYLARGASYLLGLLSYVAGQGGVGFYLARGGVRAARATGLVLFLLATNGIAIALAASLGFFADLPARRREELALVLGAAALGIGAYLVVIAARPAGPAGWTPLAPLFDAGLGGHLRAVAARLPHVLLLVVLQWGALRVWGIAVPLLWGLALMPFVLLVAALPITPSGLGTSQALQVLFFSAWAAAPSPAGRAADVLAGSLAHYVFGQLCQAALGLVCFLLLRRSPPAGGGEGAAQRGVESSAAALAPLSILLLYDCIYPESIGGVEHRNHELARALAARGHRVTLASFAAAAARPVPGVEVLPIGRPGRLYGAGGKRSTREALRFAVAAARLDLAPFDVIETANIPYAHLPVLALRCRLQGRPLVVSWIEYWGRYWRRYLGWKWPLYAAAERLTVPLGTRAMAISGLTAGRVQARRGGEVRVVPVGIPVRSIQEAAAAAAPGSGPPLLYAGRLLREKRLDLLLAAVARLARSETARAEPLLSIVGDGPDRPRLEAIAARLGLTGTVDFAGHLASNTEVWERLGRARIAVQPSSREGFGLFPLEAMAAGLPVVYCASPESALDELVAPGEHGLSTAAEPDALAAALAALLADEGERSRLAAGARRHAERFDWAAIAVEVEKLFYEALAARPAPPAPPALN